MLGLAAAQTDNMDQALSICVQVLMTIPYYDGTMVPPLEHTILLYGSTQLLVNFLIKSKT